MTNKMGSSPPEFQPSETIRETTVGLCQFLCEIFTFQLTHNCSKLEHSTTLSLSSGTFKRRKDSTQHKIFTPGWKWYSHSSPTSFAL